MFESYLRDAKELEVFNIFSQTGIKRIYLEKPEGEISLLSRFETLQSMKLMRQNDRSKRLFCQIIIHYMIFSNTSYKSFNKSSCSQEINEGFLRDFGGLIGMDYTQCLKTWLSLFEASQRSGERKLWELEEEALIWKLASEQRPEDPDLDEKLLDWNQIALSYNIHNSKPVFTSPKQLKEHFANSMRTNITKEEFHLSEDLCIIREVIKLGKKWSAVAEILQRRQCNQVKNRYYQILKKSEPLRKLRKFTKSQERQLCIQIYKKLSEGLSLEDEKLDLSSELRIDPGSSTQDDLTEPLDCEDKIFSEERDGDLFEVQRYEPSFQNSAKSFSAFDLIQQNQFIDEFLDSYPQEPPKGFRY